MKLIKFSANRVWRVYNGGAMIDQLREAAAPADGHFPEEWLASTVAAVNPQHPVAGAGISPVALPDGKVLPFDEFLNSAGPSFLGDSRPSPGFLSKLLDSSIRLPIQCHPDIPHARRLFHSPHGKTEGWVVLGGRAIAGEEPYLLMGFNEHFDAKVFREECASGVMDRTLGMMHRIPLHPWDAYVIPGGLPHAIGSGCFIQELMEPSDWVIQPESTCGDTRLTLLDRFGGLSFDDAMSCFDYRIETREQLLARIGQPPCVQRRTPEALLTLRLDRAKIGFFGAATLELDGQWRRDPERDFPGFIAGVVRAGNLTLTDGFESQSLRRGEVFGIAADAAPRFSGRATLLFALPPA